MGEALEMPGLPFTLGAGTWSQPPLPALGCLRSSRQQSRPCLVEAARASVKMRRMLDFFARSQKTVPLAFGGGQGFKAPWKPRPGVYVNVHAGLRSATTLKYITYTSVKWQSLSHSQKADSVGAGMIVPGKLVS